MPRAALLSIHARVKNTRPSTWEHPSLVQIWGPRYSVFVVAKRDLAYFTLGVHPNDQRGKLREERLAAQLHAHLAGARMGYGDVGEALGMNPNLLRYVAASGTLLIRWEGARQPTIWTIQAPKVDRREARLELARRYLHIYGPSTPETFGLWSGIGTRHATAAFVALDSELTPARTPIGEAWILAEDEAGFRAAPGHAATARLLPSGDSYLLYWGADRELVVPDAAQRRELWTSRVWPGGVLVEGEVVGTWRRAGTTVVVAPWKRLSRSLREAVGTEAEGLPLPGVRGPVTVRWED